MSFIERSYSGKISRPTPEIEIADDGSFGVIATPWGHRQSGRRAIDILRDYTLSARQDLEATSPFQKLSCLSPLANSLRVAVMLANDSIYREENRAEYTAGVEVLVFARANNEMAFAQVGAPHFLLSRPGLPWLPLSVQIDLSTEFSRAEDMLAPLPQNLIGLHSTTNMNVGSFKTQPGDRLVFLSHSVVSHPLNALSYEGAEVTAVSAQLSKQYPDLPFWLGIFELTG
jgi:hypothetical protein